MYGSHTQKPSSWRQTLRLLEAGKADTSALITDRLPLAAGLFVEASITGHSVRDVVVLPRSALRGTDQVLIVDIGPAEGRAKGAFTALGIAYTHPERHAVVV